MANSNYLKIGDVFILQCIGDRPNYRFLNGQTSDKDNGMVDLAEGFINEHLSGTLWQVNDVDSDGFHYFRCLGFADGSNRFLNGIVHSKQVNIVESTAGKYTGTRWQLEFENDHWRFNNQGQGFYLNGHTLNHDNQFKNVDLVSSEDILRNPGKITGINWAIIKLSDISFGKQSFINPIVNEGHDPWVIKNGSLYYYCFVKHNKIMISVSQELQDIGKVDPKIVFTSNDEDFQNIWAPELHFINNIWYIIFASGKNQGGTNPFGNQRTRVISSTEPTGDYGTPFSLATENFAIDGTFLSRNNELFLIWSGQPDDTNSKQVLYISKVNLTQTSIEFSGSKKVMISEPTLPWEEVGQPPKVNEGPEVLISPDNSKIHIVYSASGSWTNSYCLGLLTFTGTTNSELMKPECWQKSAKPVFSSGQGITGPYGPGHCSFVTDNNNNHWIVYHCAKYSKAGWLRWVHTQQFKWNNNKPEFGTPIPRLIPLSRN